MPDASQLGPSSPELCTACREPLGAGPWWMLDTRAYHERCAPWGSRAFPLAAELRRLRRLRGRLVRAIAAIDEVGRALREAERRSPVAAVELLIDTRAKLEALDARLRELGWRR